MSASNSWQKVARPLNVANKRNTKGVVPSVALPFICILPALVCDSMGSPEWRKF